MISDVAKRHALLRQLNQRIKAMSEEELDRELREILSDPRSLHQLDDPEWLLWLCSLAAHRANRLEARQT